MVRTLDACNVRNQKVNLVGVVRVVDDGMVLSPQVAFRVPQRLVGALAVPLIYSFHVLSRLRWAGLYGMATFVHD